MVSGVVETPVTVWSEGSRVAAVLCRPDRAADDPSPAVLLCHGWGGLKEQMIALYGRTFAAAGFACLAFDYRGWGDSDGRMIPAPHTPPVLERGRHTVEVDVVREVVDPVDQLADVRACFAYLGSEDGVDPGRIGVFGSSYGGGHAVSLAGTEPRVRAVVAQIGGYGHPAAQWFTDLAHRRAVDKARGRIDPPIPQGIDGAPGLRGTPDVARQLGHAPLEYARAIRVPTLFLDAEFEQYNDASLQGGAAYEIVRHHAVSERHTFPATHYEVYDKYLQPARQLALDWLRRYVQDVGHGPAQ